MFFYHRTVLFALKSSATFHPLMMNLKTVEKHHLPASNSWLNASIHFMLLACKQCMTVEQRYVALKFLWYSFLWTRNATFISFIGGHLSLVVFSNGPGRGLPLGMFLKGDRAYLEQGNKVCCLQLRIFTHPNDQNRACMWCTLLFRLTLPKVEILLVFQF